MPRGATTFRQRDVTAAVKAVTAAGCQVARVEVDKTGRIVVITMSAEASPSPPKKDQGDGWDDV